jgi:hypothetical protein
MKTKILVPYEDGNIHTDEVPLVSPELRAMVDNMLFLSAYGHKTMFESNRTRPAFRAPFAAYSLKFAIEKVDEFYSSWKDYQRRHPVERVAANGAGGDDGEVDLDAMMGGDSDDDVPVFPARPTAAAAAAGPAPATAAAAAAAVDGSD